MDLTKCSMYLEMFFISSLGGRLETRIDNIEEMRNKSQRDLKKLRKLNLRLKAYDVECDYIEDKCNIEVPDTAEYRKELLGLCINDSSRLDDFWHDETYEEQMRKLLSFQVQTSFIIYSHLFINNFETDHPEIRESSNVDHKLDINYFWTAGEVKDLIIFQVKDILGLVCRQASVRTHLKPKDLENNELYIITNKLNDTSDDFDIEIHELFRYRTQIISIVFHQKLLDNAEHPTMIKLFDWLERLMKIYGEINPELIKEVAHGNGDFTGAIQRSIIATESFLSEMIDDYETKKVKYRAMIEGPPREIRYKSSDDFEERRKDSSERKHLLKYYAHYVKLARELDTLGDIRKLEMKPKL